MGLSFSSVWWEGMLFLGGQRRREILIRILMVGVPGAGKTTILQKLELVGECVTTTIPKIGFNVETVKDRNVSLLDWDLSGHHKTRTMYRHYYANTDVLIFVVDASDHDRFDEARSELDRLLEDEMLQDAIFLVFANKQDLPGAMSAAEVTEKLGLHGLAHRRRRRPWHVQPCCAKFGQGLHEGLAWISEALAKKRKQESCRHEHD